MVVGFFLGQPTTHVLALFFFATTREIHFKINRIRGLLNSLA